MAQTEVLASRRDALLRELDQVDRQLDRLVEIGEDDYPVNAIVVFTRRFTGSATPFTYVALKVADDRWFLSSTKRGESRTEDRYMSWQSLLTRLSPYLVSVHYVTELEEVWSA